MTAAFAETQWERNHPRRDQVNDRLANQNRRIDRELKEGEISKHQARQLHREGHAIRQEERDMARVNGGRISKGAQSAGERGQPTNWPIVIWPGTSVNRSNTRHGFRKSRRGSEIQEKSIKSLSTSP